MASTIIPNTQILTDYELVGGDSLVLFVHGYKGFKDWGCWNLMKAYFVNKGFSFAKFNLSGNGTTPASPEDFVDLEAFGHNNYSKEISDLHTVINYFEGQGIKNIHLIGHSRGGGVVTYYAPTDTRVKSVITLASIDTFNRGFTDIEEWKKKGVKYIVNGRTNQLMPHYYQFFEDFVDNFKDCDVLDQAKRIDVPHYIVHAKDDRAVDISSAINLAKANPQAQSLILESGGHTFNCKHPWESHQLPPVFETVLNEIITFYKENS